MHLFFKRLVKDENTEYVEEKLSLKREGSRTRAIAKKRKLKRLKDAHNSAPVIKCGDFIVDNTDVSTMFFLTTITLYFFFKCLFSFLYRVGKNLWKTRYTITNQRWKLQIIL